ncbi:MAG: DUF1565 domain-containing protein [Rhizonema sp. NSF051]|nr:DUF1565 domain-containing protein [Rhizonema sp. NSF051]
MLSVSHLSVLFFTVSMGVVSVALLTTSNAPAMAQIPTSDQGQIGAKTMSQLNVLFVNPSSGDDKSNGGESTPVKTMTQALRVASSNTVIRLSQGTYSTQTGEVFPLIMKPGVSIQGDSSSKGRGITILGGGDYLSRTFGSKNITIVGANSASLTGVTVTNPNPRGYGLWIETTSPVIEQNTFTGSTQDGVSVTGDSTPTVRNNYFYRNGANGITITGNSRAEVRSNVFEQTGYGINIAQNASPTVVGNSVQNNRSGILVQASSRPLLRNNLIQDSREDGLVALSQAIPDLGNASEPGGNQFRNNARYDINASTAKQTIVAYGNSLNGDRVIGMVDTSGTIARGDARKLADAATGGREHARNLALSTSRRLPQVASSNSVVQNDDSRQLNRLTVPPQPVLPPAAPQLPTSKNAGFPTPSNLRGDVGRLPATTTQVSAKQPTTSQLNYVRISPNSIEFTAPQSAPVAMSSNTQVDTETRQGGSAVNLTEISPRQIQPANVSEFNPVASTSVKNSSQRQTLPVLEPAPVGNAALLPVPNLNIPTGNTSIMPKLAAPQTATLTKSADPPQTVATATQTDVRYRVMVQVQNERDLQVVKVLAPGAFQTVWRGVAVMQAGVFNSRNHADSMVKIFNNNGLKATVEPLN